MRKIIEIARREYIDTVKTRTFLFSLLFTPVLTVGIIYFTSRISSVEGGRPPVKVVVTDLSTQLAGEIETALSKHNKSNPKRQILFESLAANDDANAIEEQGKAQLRSGRAEAYIVIDQNIIDGAGRTHVYTYKSKPTTMDATWAVEEFIRNAVVAQRCKVQNVSQKLLDDIRNVPVERVEIGEAANEQRVQSQNQTMIKLMVPFFFMFMIYMGIIGIGQQMLSSVIEEKNSRIIEMLLSAVSPFELMAGKILGLGAIGLTIVGLWTTVSYGSIVSQGISVDISGKLLFCFVVYYILGFLLFSSLLAAIGSICNTLKETQELMMPIILVMVLPMIAWFKLVQSPDGIFARVLSLVPPVSPLVMPLRISAGSNVGIVEILASVGLLAASVLLMMWLAGKIFRTGILMYGKRPSLREISRWLRAT
ncbi:MAG: ABC transporter permease [Sedimentisphaerales bacterium]|jgi:ABC-2 type transport system permease protein